MLYYYSDIDDKYCILYDSKSNTFSVDKIDQCRKVRRFDVANINMLLLHKSEMVLNKLCRSISFFDEDSFSLRKVAIVGIDERALFGRIELDDDITNLVISPSVKSFSAMLTVPIALNSIYIPRTVLRIDLSNLHKIKCLSKIYVSSLVVSECKINYGTVDASLLVRY